ncbi:hypothetical protein Caci_8991 [Catenulispora acidiphila DSM 44928]|uniref:Uncharacterized protein n=1 Tax=Catenulispora acidiphila (strain DSM 44928 / JCM 14897 / NBRC 102108 / NRRL B-24433 / ID139908) TaxID=479433 RepID=C7Q5J3_CATAD|nr:hypothetical protein [Catenulispora acidiphila]ACU77804.1 hypothetical protein Caci_8991 [Catenulispora acidiphila DSM 44928]
MTTDTVFAEDLAVALAALDVDTELVRVAWAEIHAELRTANIYGTLLCRTGSCRTAGIMSRGAIRLYGYAPDLRAVPVGDCGRHEAEEAAQRIAELIEYGRLEVESRATYPEAWAHESPQLWMGYRWKSLDALARM